MIAILFGCGSPFERPDFCAANEHVRLAGAGIEIDELAAVEVGKVLAVGGPFNIFRQLADEGAVGKDLIDGERYSRSLGREVSGEKTENEDGSRHKRARTRERSQRKSSGAGACDGAPGGRELYAGLPVCSLNHAMTWADRGLRRAIASTRLRLDESFDAALRDAENMGGALLH